MATLNLANFTTVLDDDFTKDHSLNTNIWSAHWGNANQYSFTGTSNGLMLSGSAAANWNPVGFEQAPWSKSTGEGYGLFSFKGFAGQAGQGVGICFVLWPSDNVWLPSNKAGQASEIDILESWDGTKNGYSTLHYYQPGSNNNGQEIHQLKVDLTVSHTYAMDWEAGSLTFYIDGQQIYQNTSHVPLDFAHGGVNETMGAEVVNGAALVTTPTVQFYVQDISYSTANAGTVNPPPPPTPTPSSITLSAPGTLQEASAGAGVTVTETVSATGMTALYAEVLTKAGAVESSWQTISLDATGHASFTAHLAQSGDTIRAVDSTASPTVTTNSTPVTITEPVAAPPVVASITVDQPATLGVGMDSFTGKVTGNPKSVELAWHNGGNEVDGASDFVKVTPATDGSFSILLSVDHPGVASTLYADLDGKVSALWSMTPSAAPTPSSITLSAPGTLQEASVGAGVTVTETVSATGMTALYAEVLTKAGAVESSWQTVSLDATGHASFTAHLAQSGDTIRAVDSTASPTVTANSTPVTITEPVATGSLLLGQSAAGPLSFSVLDGSRGGKRILELDVLKTVGKKATLREFIDHKYYGTLRDGLADGSFTIRTAALAAGAHSILLTLDGSTATATAAFTVPALKAAATSVAGQVQVDVTSPARLSTVLSISTASGGSAAILPDTTGGSAAQLLAMTASSVSTTLLHVNT